jgi:hypothetical protein
MLNISIEYPLTGSRMSVPQMTTERGLVFECEATHCGGFGHKDITDHTVFLVQDNHSIRWSVIGIQVSLNVGGFDVVLGGASSNGCVVGSWLPTQIVVGNRPFI